MTPHPATPSDDADSRDALRDQLQETRRRLRRMRDRRDELAMSLERAQNELAMLRSYTLDVFPELELDDEVEQTIKGVIETRLTYLGEQPLRSLVACAAEAEATNRPGLFIECGTALGGSAIAMAAAKDPRREMRVYDAFGMIPPPTDKDGDRVMERYQEIVDGKSRGIRGDTYYGYRTDLLGEVTQSFAHFGVPIDGHSVSLVPGLFEDTLEVDRPVALAHIDGDWYESTMTCLQRIAPHLAPGGRIVIDDYYYWAGCQVAVDEYVTGRAEFRLEHRGRLHIVRVGPDHG